MFQLIDRSTWKREEYFNHYFSDVPCTYSMTVRLDITELRVKRVSLYPTMLYLIACVVNRHEEFRTAYTIIFPLAILSFTKKAKPSPTYGLHIVLTIL